MSHSENRGRIVWTNGSGIGAAPSEKEPPGGELGQRILERSELPSPQHQDRWSAGGPGDPDPAAKHGGAGLLGRLGQEIEEDAELRPVIKLAGEERQRVCIEHLAE